MKRTKYHLENEVSVDATDLENEAERKVEFGGVEIGRSIAK